MSCAFHHILYLHCNFCYIITLTLVLHLYNSYIIVLLLIFYNRNLFIFIFIFFYTSFTCQKINWRQVFSCFCHLPDQQWMILGCELLLLLAAGVSPTKQETPLCSAGSLETVERSRAFNHLSSQQMSHSKSAVSLTNYSFCSNQIPLWVWMLIAAITEKDILQLKWAFRVEIEINWRTNCSAWKTKWHCELKLEQHPISKARSCDFFNHRSSFSFVWNEEEQWERGRLKFIKSCPPQWTLNL